MYLTLFPLVYNLIGACCIAESVHVLGLVALDADLDGFFVALHRVQFVPKLGQALLNHALQNGQKFIGVRNLSHVQRDSTYGGHDSGCLITGDLVLARLSRVAALPQHRLCLQLSHRRRSRTRHA